MVDRCHDIEAELDLHGCYRYEVRDPLLTFLRESRAERFRTVAVVVGRGNHSPEDEGVLGPYVRSLLNAENIRYEVASERDGGAGVLIIHLA